MNFLPSLFGPRLMLVGECTVFDFMARLSNGDYGGGMWTFYELGAQPLFMAPASAKAFHIRCASNGFAGVMTAEAAGIVATLFTFSHLSFRFESEQLVTGYARLYEYMGDHPEAGEIFQAID